MNFLKRCRYGMFIYNKKDTRIGKSLDLYGEYAEQEIDFFRKLIRPGNLVLDVGANIGTHTIFFSRMVGKDGVVIAFEPERQNYYTLCGNIAINSLPNIHAFQQALGNKTDSIIIPEINHEDLGDFGGISLATDYSQVPNYQVPLLQIDDLNINCQVIKLSTPGMDQAVLEGATQTISKHKPLIHLSSDQKPYLYYLGYKVYSYQATLFNPKNFFNCSENIFGDQKVTNYLACHRETNFPLEIFQEFGLILG